jgi:dTDP-glucose pyrophosphorylase/CBS domain-containing protein
MDLSSLCMAPHQTLREAMLCIDRNKQGVALVVNSEQRLVYTITDGDLRRAVLQRLSLDTSITEWAQLRPEFGNRHPTTAPMGTPSAVLMRLMQTAMIRHVPLTDEAGRVVDLALLSDLTAETNAPFSAVVMAGGQGTRLRPLTDELPKPMLPVGDRPLMEHIVNQLRSAGIRQVNVTTHYKPEAITRHFGDGRKFGVKINYVHEEDPLGTAGALGLIPKPSGPLLVINGDILSRVNFRAMLDFHHEYEAQLTMGVRLYEHQVPYGVVEPEGVVVRQLSEKPTVRLFVNAGIYLLDPMVFDYLPGGERALGIDAQRPAARFDMPELIQRLLADGRRVVSFPINEYWRDIGQHADYELALEDIRVGNC